MVFRLWQRPSIVVVAAAAIWLGVFVGNGTLRLADGAERTAAAATGTESQAHGSLSERRVPTKAAEPAPVVVRVGRPAATAMRQEVRGKVVDATGFLVVGAEVLAAGADIVRTDASGVFSVSLPQSSPNLAGEFAVRVTATGHRPQELRGSRVAPDQHFVRMVPSAPWDVPANALPAMDAVPAAALFGEGFVRGLDGRPTSGAYVTVAGSGVWARTDEIGRYTLPLRNQPLVLVVHQPDAGRDGQGMAVRSATFTPAREQGMVPLPELVVEPAAMLRGRVADGGGVPLSGVPIEVRGEGIARVLESGISGVFRLSGLLPGNYEVRPFPHRGAVGRKQSITIGEGIAECVVALDALIEQRIRVLDESGRPMPRVHVAATVDGERCAVAQADQDGWAAMRAAGDRTQWEVRATDSMQPLPVRHFESDAIVVAVP